MSEITPVIRLVSKNNMALGSEGRLKRLAIQIAAQLPDDAGEALSVLAHAETIVRSFLSDSKPS